MFFGRLRATGSSRSLSREVQEICLPLSLSDSKWAHLVQSEEIFDFYFELLTSFRKPYLSKLMLGRFVQLLGYGV
jgi:hypothetical protein